MTKKQVWQYKCDFCGKRRYRKSAMEVHEAGCTLNPNRICRMHAYCDGSQRPTEYLIGSLEPVNIDGDHLSETEKEERNLAKLREVSDGCPACMLAALRQARQYAIKFNFKEECDKFWSEHNEEAYQYHHM
jgi:hypothetical protein